MKQLFIILIALSFNFCFGQIADNTCNLNDRNIYYQALVQLYNSEHSDKNAVRDTVYIENEGVADSIITESYMQKFIIIKARREELIKMTDTNLTFLQLSPLEYKNGSFYIPIKRFWIAKKEDYQKNEFKVLDCFRLQFDFLGRKFIYKRKLVCN